MDTRSDAAVVAGAFRFTAAGMCRIYFMPALYFDVPSTRMLACARAAYPL